MLPLQFASIRAKKTSFETFVFDGHMYASINGSVYETEALATEAEDETKTFSLEA